VVLMRLTALAEVADHRTRPVMSFALSRRSHIGRESTGRGASTRVSCTGKRSGYSLDRSGVLLRDIRSPIWIKAPTEAAGLVVEP
jgi:hypothetical protein